MGLFRLSFLTNYISDPLISGFTTGAAFHVLFSQLDKAIGVKIRRENGPGMLIRVSFFFYNFANFLDSSTFNIENFGY